MVIQFEDCVDCLTVLYPQYDYVFLFDHSCGHDKQREGGLFWMTAEERERKRKDVWKDGTRKLKRNKQELIKMLQERGITATGKAEDIKKLQKTMGYLPKLKSR
jgi:hypothetical protein